MKYWNWPVTGVGSHTYHPQGYSTQSANFGNTTYHWSDMPNSVGYPNEAVGTLQWHAGIAVNMGYSPSGSGAQSSAAANALRQYFRYNTALTLYSKEDYSDSQWEDLLRTELDNVHPLYYDGYGSAGGHAFVCDGYQGTNYFHFNWGWSGAYDGYYYTSNLNPGTAFNWGQNAMFNVQPLNYALNSLQVSLASSNCSVGDIVSIPVTTYPLLPAWNVTAMSLNLDYDAENLNYIGFENTGNMSEGATVTVTVIQPGQLQVSISADAPFIGAGTILRLKFQPMLPGEYALSLDNVNFNNTSITQLNPTSFTAIAEVTQPQNTVIDILNAMQVPYNEVAALPMTTTFILPTWNVANLSFDVLYQNDRISWQGYDTTGCLLNNAAIEVTQVSCGILHFSAGIAGNLSGNGNLLKLRFQAIGNTDHATVATISLNNFYLGTTPLQNLSPGYIVLYPLTANEEQVGAATPSLTVSPNPFRDNALIRLTLPKQVNQAVLEIYNAKGQLVRSLRAETHLNGKAELQWDGKTRLGEITPAGVYLLRYRAGTFEQTQKLLKL